MKPRKRKCPICRDWYVPWNSLQRTCRTPACALEFARLDKAKRRTRELREQKRKLKTRGELMKEAQSAFNAFIRIRDANQPCISCGTWSPQDSHGGKWDCGHYRSTGANPELRFEELNAMKQCKHCNQHLSGNVVNFRIGLRHRIGDAALEWLEGPHEQKKYTKDDLRAVRDEYRAKRRELEKQREAA